MPARGVLTSTATHIKYRSNRQQTKRGRRGKDRNGLPSGTWRIFYYLTQDYIIRASGLHKSAAARAPSKARNVSDLKERLLLQINIRSKGLPAVKF